MGVYLNNVNPYTMYRSECAKPYFVDKSLILQELCPLAEQGNNHICITRPRRFGKTIMANMVGAFFSKGRDSGDIFGSLQIGRTKEYEKNLNRYNVIYISFNELPRRCRTYDQYIERIEKNLTGDLRAAYPDQGIHEEDALWDALMKAFSSTGREKFIFVLDEWDFIFHRDFITDEDRKEYISFLSNLLKDKPYVSMTYMTGILPIAKYSSGSELNMFIEFSMAAQEKFSDYFGFTQTEVQELYRRYMERTGKPAVSLEGLGLWYDGYYTASGERIYNPRSVAAALGNNRLANYWTSSGPYDEIFYYINKNVDDLKAALALMVSGEGVPAKIQEYAATSMELKTKDEIFSAMVVYGFLSYTDGKVFIPNKELMDKFSEMLQREESLGYINRLAAESERMLAATLRGDTETMEEILEYAHNTETPLLAYNSEAELAAVVNLVYLSARDKYVIKREDKAGTGYVDFVFYPKTDKGADCIILELKVDHAPEEAIAQIRERNYALCFCGKLGEEQVYTGRILAVGIGYCRKDKKHACKIEILR